MHTVLVTELTIVHMYYKSWFRSIFLFRLIYMHRRNRSLYLCNLNIDTQMTTGNSSLSRLVVLYCTKTKKVNNRRDFKLSLRSPGAAPHTSVPHTPRSWSSLTCSSHTSASTSGIALPLTQNCLRSFFLFVCFVFLFFFAYSNDSGQTANPDTQR